MIRLALVFIATLAGPALAHPHAFINASVTATINDENILTGVRIRWDYDDYVSLLLVTDTGADADGDGTLTEAELTPLQGFDMTWAEGFDGDTVLTQGDAPVALQKGPAAWKTGWQDQHLWSEHGRMPQVPVDLSQGPVTVTLRDITDYTAYTLVSAQLSGSPSDCRIAIVAPESAGSGLGSILGLFVFGGVMDDAPIPVTQDQKAVISCDG